jgi:PAS domain S-box-containing protein
MDANDETGARTPTSTHVTAGDQSPAIPDCDGLLSEQRFVMAFDKAPVGMTLIGPDFRFVRVNSEFCKMLGYSEEDLLGRSIADITHPDDVPRNVELATELFRGDRPSYRLTKRLVSKEGEIVWVDISSVILKDRGGKPLLGFAVIEDITESMRAEDALRTSEERYRSFVVNSSEGIWRFESEEPIDVSLPFERQKELIFKHVYVAECNDAMARTYGFDRAEDIIGFRFGQLFKDDPSNELSVIDFIKSGYRLRDVETVEQNIKGETIYLMTSVIGIVVNGFLMRAWGTQRDETERKIAEKKLEASHQQLRALAAYLQEIRENERTEIAREIHDVLGQALTALKIDISWLNKHVVGNGSKADEGEVRTRLTEANKLLDETLVSVKNLSAELRPRVLDTFGFTAAMEWLCSDFQRRTGINCQCNACDADPLLSPEKSTTLFRILQESMTNVARHSNAKNVGVGFEQKDGKLVLSIKDDGIGITDEELTAFDSLGILGMQERAERIGGNLSITQVPEGGTLVTVELPENG